MYHANLIRSIMNLCSSSFNCLILNPVDFIVFNANLSYYKCIMTGIRTRTNKGIFRPVRSDTKVGTIEKKYGVDLGVRSNMKLGNYLNKKGYPSLSSMLQKSK